MTIDNQQVAAIFGEMGDLLEIQGGSEFRIRAFRRMAQAIEDLPESVATMLEANTLKKVPGIGKGAISRIEQIIETGDCDDHRQLRSELPSGLLDMLRISGMGPKTVRLVYAELGVTSVDALEAACNDGHLAKLPRMGEKSQQKILKSIEAYRRHTGRIPLGKALPQGLALADALASCPAVQKIDLAGSSRRRRETIGDLDLLVAADEVEPVMDLFVALPAVDEVMLRGDTKCSVRLASSLQVDLRVLKPESYGAALHYFTGSQMHNIAIRDRAKRAGLRINEYGVYREPSGERLCGETEEEVFGSVGLPYIPPELRENRGEIEAAERGELPKLITYEDLRGDLHIHTTESDGVDDQRTMAKAAMALGYQYLAITEHSKGLAFANGLDEQRLLAQTKQLRALEDELGGIRLLSGVEVDIRRDGTLDIEAAVLRELDWVVASVHTSFELPAEEQTRRMISALETGLVDCIGHPTGRLLGERDPYAVDLDQLLTAAQKLGVSVELNAHPSRLDLDSAHCRQARDLGVMVAINTDAHAAEQIGRTEYGIATARRGWLEPANVLNAQGIETVERLRSDRLPSAPKGEAPAKKVAKKKVAKKKVAKKKVAKKK